MPKFNALQILTVVPNGAISPHRFVNYSNAQAGAGQAARGITHDGAEAGDKSCPVITAGTAIVEAGGAFAAGAKLTSDANGKAVAAAAGQVINAIAIDAAAADGDLVEVERVAPVANA